MELVFGHTDGRTDGTGWTDGRGSQNSYSDVMKSYHIPINNDQIYITRVNP